MGALAPIIATFVFINGFCRSLECSDDWTCEAKFTMGSVARTINSTVKLNDGVVMPMFGLGVYLIKGELEILEAVGSALKYGYRLIDTAEFYRNEEGIGKAIKQSGIDRKDIFVVTKLLNHGREVCLESFNKSLARLDTEYVDLYLIHHPMDGKILESYDAMLELKEKGLIRSVGVSNFNIHHLEGLRAAGRPLPSVNQIELNVFMQQRPLVEYCREHGITVMGYSPLARMQKQDNKVVNELAKKYQKTVAQIMIRWSLQKDYITIPKSGNPKRILENSQVFDFELTPEEMDELEKQPTHQCTSWHPLDVPWKG